jgi:hypothetical protein
MSPKVGSVVSLHEIPEHILEKLEISRMIANYVTEELGKEEFNVIAVPTHSNNLRHDDRYGSVNIIVEKSEHQRSFLFFKRKKTRSNHICGISVYYNKVEIRGPTYPEHYEKISIQDPGFIDKVIRYVNGCVNRLEEYPCLWYDEEKQGYDQGISNKRIKVLNIPINPS